MIFVSSSCIKNKYIWESVEKLANLGYKNIELSGGTERSSSIFSNLKKIKNKYSLNFRCHNYFPPPKKHFVMNLASDSEIIYKNTSALINEALELSRKLESKEYGFHAGFLTDISPKEIGKSIKAKNLSERKDAIKRFNQRIIDIVKKNRDIKIYVENNVLSKNNFQNFNKENPFLLTSFEDINQLSKDFEFNIILDVAHLFVSCTSLNLDFQDQFRKFILLSDYIHISDNNGLSDQNKRLKKNSEIFNALKNANLQKKTFTIEVNNDLNGIKHTYETLQDLI
tara:strand:+ start:1435 stop:2283 length:849 start_codon:yes stop_codon:yes gene_type:complete